MVRARDNSAESKKESSSATRGSKASSSVKKKNSSTGVWPCNVNGCSKQFQREADLKRHRRTTKLHATSVAGSQCPQCDATFTRTDALRRHQKSRHNGVVLEAESSNVDDEPDYSSEHMEDEYSSGGSGSRSPSSPTGRGKQERQRPIVNYREPDPDEGTAYYRPPAFAQPRTIMSSQYAQTALPTSSTRSDASVPRAIDQERQFDDDSDESDDEVPSSSTGHAAASPYPSSYYGGHYPTSSSPPVDYWEMYRSVDKPSRSKHSSHWKTSSQRSTASLGEQSDDDMSLDPSDTAVASSSGVQEESKLRAFALALSPGVDRARINRGRGESYSARSSDAETAVNDGVDDTFTDGLHSRYREAAPSLRSTQSEDFVSRPRLRQRDSATRSTFNPDLDDDLLVPNLTETRGAPRRMVNGSALLRDNGILSTRTS